MAYSRFNPSWHRNHRPSPLARMLLLCYAMLVVLVTLYPLTGWRDTGIPPWAFLTAPLPRYQTRFDLFSNAVAYVPLGTVAAWAFFPLGGRWRGWLGAALAGLFGSALSLLLEAAQTYLPGRVPSNVDLALNAAGAWLGAVLGASTVRLLLGAKNLTDLRQRWGVPHLPWGFALLLLWLAAQLHPQPVLFGLGDVLKPLLAWLSQDGEPWRIVDWLRLNSEERRWLEVAISAGELAGAGLLLSTLLLRHAPRRTLLLLLTVLALGLHSLGDVLLNSNVGWWTRSAAEGAIVGLTLLLLLARIPEPWRRQLGRLLLLAALLALNVLPDDPYFLAQQAASNPGSLTHLLGLLDWFALLAPWALLIGMRTPTNHKYR